MKALEIGTLGTRVSPRLAQLERVQPHEGKEAYGVPIGA